MPTKVVTEEEKLKGRNCTRAAVSSYSSHDRPFICLKAHALTPGDPTWNPCTVMRTVSPTFALLGDIKSFGPLGAAEKKKTKQTDRQRSLC